MSLSIGISCFATFGGSGIVATEIGLGMAQRGHRVHFICAELPRRLEGTPDNVSFHEVRARDYDVFPQVPYELALASRIVSVATHHGLDVLHAHYAIPHAASGWMAREVLGGAMKVVTTLHGTDITLVGSDESYLPITRHSIQQSDAVTTPSRYLRDETLRRFGLDPERVGIEVIPNFVDTARLCPRDGAGRPALRALFGEGLGDDPALVHVSNFRSVKRVDRVVEIFARVAARRPCRLLLVGDGPDRPVVEAMLRDAGLADRTRMLGSQTRFEGLLSECAAFLLPSETESFGLAALEALSCGVPVVASDVGGLREVVREGHTGFLVDPDDVEGMARRVVDVLDDGGALAAGARADVLERFAAAPILDRYEALYRRVCGSP